MPKSFTPDSQVPSSFKADTPAAPQQSLASSVWNNILDVAQKLPTAPLGNAVGNSVRAIGAELTGNHAQAQQLANENGNNFGKIVGSTIYSAATPASLALSAPASILGSAAQYGALGAATSGGEALAGGASLGDSAKQAAIGGGIGAGLGVGFNLLGKVINKVAAPISSVTSGVPKAAIEQAGVNPDVTKQGVNMSVEQVRAQAMQAHQALTQDLGSEFKTGLQQIGNTPAANADALGGTLAEKAKSIVEQYKVPLQGAIADFSKSSIVNPGEQKALQETLNTVNSWTDFSPQGMQQLSERVGALRNFDSNGVSKSSSIIGKIYNAIGGEIKSSYPELAQLRTNYATNKKVLDEIGNVIGSTAKKPTQVQAAVTRLDNIFAQNKDEYINIIRQLGDKSGTDFLSLLAGGEFQKLLPGYIRSAVAVGSVGGIGAAASNPLSLLLLPLFSPRAVGVVARNAPAIAKTTSQVVQGAATQAIPQIAQALAPQKRK